MIRDDRRRATDSDLADELQQLDVLLVCGSGGVGKTSIAAALAVAEAQRGRKVCVLTIDPARRLADAMGLSSLSDVERSVKLPDGTVPGGSLHALMLDPQSAFDRLVAEVAENDAERDRVLGNRIYQQLAQGTSGMQEYMALERLYELDRGDRYDLIVVDTPPTTHARDLLDSPHRMLRFLEGKSLRWFLKPGMKAGKFGLRAIGGSNGPVMGLLQRITGAQMIRDITEFFESMETMYDAFTERIRIVERMFSNPATGFIVVTSPERESIDQSVDFWQLLGERNYRFVGTIVNRVEPEQPEGELDRAAFSDLDEIDDSLAARLIAAQLDHAHLARRDAERLAHLTDATADALTVAVPRIPVLVNDLHGLSSLAPYLLGDAAS